MQKDMATLDPVRKSIYAYMPHLKYVSVNTSVIASIADDLATEAFELPEWRESVFPDEREPGTSAEDIIDFLFIGNSINFAFREFSTGDKFAAEYDGKEWTGAFAMWACLKRAYDEGEPILSGEYLRQLSMDDVHRLFQPVNGIDLPLLETRYDILSKVGERLVADYQGQFHNLVRQSSNRLYADGSGIVDRLVSDFPSFNDAMTISTDEGKFTIRFYKRAQLAPAMAYGRFRTRPPVAIDDVESFTVFADYNLPNVLRYLGALEYAEPLAEIIDSVEPLPAQSRKEGELRVATIYAADLLMEAINTRREDPIYAPQLDAKLFLMRDEADAPVHLTRTTAY